MVLRAAVRHLQRHQGRPLSDFVADTDARWVIERGMQLCAQNALDVATHLAVATGHDVADYGSAVEALGRSGVLPTEFSSAFRSVAGFRNVIVHAYLEVDVAQLHAFLDERLGDFLVFADHVDDWMASGA